jgi:hypothetical protein
MKVIFAMLLAIPVYMAIGFSVETTPYLICAGLLQFIAGLEDE